MSVAPRSERKLHAMELFSGLGSRYDLMGALLSFGQDPRWRGALVSAVGAGPGDRVLDVATGTGMVASELVERYGCRVVGLDQSEPMLARARLKLDKLPRLGDRIDLVRGEAEALPFADAAFDHLTFTYLLRYVDDPASTLHELARVVKPGGRIASLEFGVPGQAPLRAMWRAWTRAGLPMIGRLASRDWQRVGRFLGPNIEEHYERYPLSEQRAMWARAGIGAVEIRRMSFGAGVVISGVRDGG